MSLGRRLGLAEVVTIAGLALAAAGCKPLNGGLGGACNLSCPRASTRAFCHTIDDACDAELGAACVGVVGSGGTCSRSCVRDDDCRGAVVPMICSTSTCLREESICLRGEDARQFCGNVSPPISCIDLQLRGDGICDGPTGTNHCADDPADCGGQEPWPVTCAANCQKVRRTACPLDDLSACEATCVSTVARSPACRSQAKAIYDCQAGDGAFTCGDDQKSQDTGLCAAQYAALTACQVAFATHGT